MPLLLDALENANGPDYRKLRAKAMECAGLIGMAAFQARIVPHFY
jgi:importin-5